MPESLTGSARWTQILSIAYPLGDLLRRAGKGLDAVDSLEKTQPDYSWLCLPWSANNVNHPPDDENMVKNHIGFTSKNNLTEIYPPPAW